MLLLTITYVPSKHACRLIDAFVDTRNIDPLAAYMKRLTVSQQRLKLYNRRGPGPSITLTQAQLYKVAPKLGSALNLKLAKFDLSVLRAPGHVDVIEQRRNDLCKAICKLERDANLWNTLRARRALGLDGDATW